MGAPHVLSIPRIATPRLLLREFRIGDFDGFAQNLADPEAMKFLSGPSDPSDRRAAWRIFCSATGGWVLHGKGWWAVELRETGEMVGTVGAFLRESAPDLELGWTLYPRFWGRGYATEAARAALEHAFEVHHVKRAIAHIKAANTASVAVSQKLGMTYETDVDFYGDPVGRYAIER